MSLTSPPSACTRWTCAPCWRCSRRSSTSGATVVVIEHDLDVISNADYVIDMGPGGGKEGGRIVAAGTPAEIAQTPQSVTGKFLK